MEEEEDRTSYFNVLPQREVRLEWDEAEAELRVEESTPKKLEKRKWGVKELKSLLRDNHVDTTLCLTKDDLITLAVKTGLLYPSSLQPIPQRPKGKPVEEPAVYPSPPAPSGPVTLPPEFDDMVNSALHEMKGMLVGPLLEQIRDVKLDGMHDTVDVGKGVGPVAFSLEGIVIDQAQVDPENVMLVMNEGTISVQVVDIALGLQPFEWSFEKKKFPKLSSAGTAEASATKTNLAARISLAIDLSKGVELKTEEASVTIGDLSIRIKKSRLSAIINALIFAFKRVIRKQLETVMTSMVTQVVEEGIGAIIGSLLESMASGAPG